MKTLAALLLTASIAHAGGVVIVADGRVPQYKDAIAGAREIAREATLVDLAAADAADQVKRADPSVVLAVGQKALALARAAAGEKPVVFCMVLGSAAAASGRNLTGVRLEVAPQIQLEHIRMVAPTVKRIGVIYEPRASGAYLEEALKAAGRLGLTLVTKPVNDAKEVRSALNDIASGIDGLWLMPDPKLVSAEMFNYLLATTLERKIALFGFLDSFTQAGALASSAPDYTEVGRRCGKMANEVAGRPGQPLPSPVGAPGALTVNLKTARQLGMDVPRSAQDKARQVFK
jgi:putative ABC transport system substrate-binding protein